MQETIIIGNITQDAQIKDWNGSQFIAFSVADNETYRDREGTKHERTTYVSCLKPVFNGNTNVAPFLKKGTLVYLRGRVSAPQEANPTPQMAAGGQQPTVKMDDGDPNGDLPF